MNKGIPKPEKVKWITRSIFPGFQTKDDRSKVEPGAGVAGQNVSFNYGKSISVRPYGYATYPDGATEETDTDPVPSVHTFRRRDGENVMMRSTEDLLQYYDEDSGYWETIKSGYTDGEKFGFVDYNINTDLRSYVYFCNAVEPFSRWTGNHTALTVAVAAGDTVIYVEDTTGFPASGAVVINGVEVGYGSLTATQINLSSPAGTTFAIGRGITEAVETFVLNPRGNILLAPNNRIFVAGITATPQAVYFSEYGDPTNFASATLVTDSTATAPGIFNLAEGGGGVIGLVMDELSTYAIKKSIIYKITLSDSFYTLEPLKPFDGKSQTTGGIGAFTGENGVIFITPDRKILYLTRLPTIDYPQLSPISDIIKRTVEALYFDNAAGIVFRERAFIACASESGGQNDTVLIYNLVDRIWEAPVVGWFVSDFLIYDNGTGDQLFFASNNSKNVFRITNTAQDGEFDVLAGIVLNQENFGNPPQMKYINNMFFEGYIQAGTELIVTILLDDDGYTHEYRATINGNNDDILFSNDVLNVFGSNPFGFEVFGSNPENPRGKKFRVYTKDGLRDIPFYNISVGFSSSGSQFYWEILNYAFHVGIFSQPEDRQLYIGFDE